MSNFLIDYEIQGQIGQGSFATVYKGVNKHTKQVVAIKAVDKEKLNKKLAENLETEISILKGISNPNIIQLFDIQKSEEIIYLVMEFCEGGDLSHLLKKKKLLMEDQVKGIVRQLANALECMRKNNLVHRDLKPQNLLLTSLEDTACLKVADFGFARFIHHNDMAETLCGSPLYMAPEILRYEKYDAKADLWSVGAIMFEMLYGRPPFRAQNHIQLLKNIEANPVNFPSHVAATRPGQEKQLIPITISDECKDLITRLLKKDPIERIGFEEFFMHPFLARDQLKKSSSAGTMAISSSVLDQRRSSVPILSTRFQQITQIPSPRTVRANSIGTKLSTSFKSASKFDFSLTKSISLFGTPRMLSLASTDLKEEEKILATRSEQLARIGTALFEIYENHIPNDTPKGLSDSLVLLIKIMQVFNLALLLFKPFSDKGRSLSDELYKGFQWLTDHFSNCFELAENIKLKILAEHIDLESNLCDLIVSYAIKLARIGADDELHGYMHAAEKMYSKSLLLLELLYDDQHNLKINSTETNIIKIQKQAKLILQRLEQVRLKKRAK